MRRYEESKRPVVVAAMLACVLTGCNDPASVMTACFAPEVTARAQAVQVEVYLVASCESVEPPARPSNAIATTFSIRDERRGAPIDVPPPGDYALYALARAADESVVAVGCAPVTAAVEGWATPPSVRMDEFECQDDSPCVVETEACGLRVVGTGGAGGAAGSVGSGGTPSTGGNAGGGGTDCTDLDEDGYCASDDCDDTVPTCNVDCETNSDEDAQPDCFEQFCGSNPMATDSSCTVIGDEDELVAAFEDAAETPGPAHFVLGTFTITDKPPPLNGDGGVTLRQTAGDRVTVDLEMKGKVFDLQSHNNVVDGLWVIGLSEAESAFAIKGNDNIVRNSIVEGFKRRGIYVERGDRAQVIGNVISGGTDAPDKETGGIVLRETDDTIVVGNTVTFNRAAGIQVRDAKRGLIDGNTVSNNDGAGLDFYESPSSEMCIRNNTLTANAAALAATAEVTFDETQACTAPLAPGPAYNNTESNHPTTCTGPECTSCTCLPPTFW